MQQDNKKDVKMAKSSTLNGQQIVLNILTQNPKYDVKLLRENVKEYGPKVAVDTFVATDDTATTPLFNVGDILTIGKDVDENIATRWLAESYSQTSPMLGEFNLTINPNVKDLLFVAPLTRASLI
jgi:hypothetical protein